MEPFLTTLVASLTAGAVAASKDVASSAVTDAYAAIKSFLADRYGSLDLGALEQNPENETVLAELGASVETSGALGDEQIHALAEQLKAALQEDEKIAQEIGLELHHVKIGTANISDIVGFSKAAYMKYATVDTLNVKHIKRSAEDQKKNR